MADAFDPLATEDEAASKSQYFSKKDLKSLAIGFAILIVLLIPVYMQLKADRDQHVCKSNFKAIFDSMGLYGAENDDRYPPVYAVGGPNDMPLLNNGKAFTWCTLVQPFMNKRSTMVCPTAEESENSSSVRSDGSGETLFSSYGMYVAYSGYPRALISNLQDTIIVGETSNMGANGTYDPMPFKDPDGKPVGQDGFVMGYDKSNRKFVADSKYVTRLAFRNTKSGDFTDGSARHPGGNFFLTAEGSVKMFKSPIATIKTLAGEPQSPWTAPPSAIR